MASVYIVVRVENGDDYHIGYESNVAAFLDEKQAVDDCRNRNELGGDCRYRIEEIALDDE